MAWKDEIQMVEEDHPKGHRLQKDGSEYPDPVPMAPPVGFNPQPSMFEVMRRMIQEDKVRQALEAEGMESPEEADDFDIGDDYEPSSPYEHNFDHVADPGELQRLRHAIDVRERYLRGEAVQPPAAPARGEGDRGGSEAGPKITDR